MLQVFLYVLYFCLKFYRLQRKAGEFFCQVYYEFRAGFSQEFQLYQQLSYFFIHLFALTLGRSHHRPEPCMAQRCWLPTSIFWGWHSSWRSPSHTPLPKATERRGESPFWRPESAPVLAYLELQARLPPTLLLLSLKVLLAWMRHCAALDTDWPCLLGCQLQNTVFMTTATPSTL